MNKANKGTPQKITLAAINGAIAQTGYPEPYCYKTDQNLVFLHADIQMQNQAAFEAWGVYMMLPVGFRPATTIPVIPIATDKFGSSVKYTHGISIRADGTIAFVHTNSSAVTDCQVLRIYAVFVAE